MWTILQSVFSRTTRTLALHTPTPSQWESTAQSGTGRTGRLTMGGWNWTGQWHHLLQHTKVSVWMLAKYRTETPPIASLQSTTGGSNQLIKALTHIKCTSSHGWRRITFSTITALTRNGSQLNLLSVPLTFFRFCGVDQPEFPSFTILANFQFKEN